MNSRKYLFIDRDGTLIEEPSDFQIDTIEKFRLLPEVIPSLLRLKNAGYRFVLISNQDGLGSETYPQKQFDLIQTLLLSILQTQGISFEEILICPHSASEGCLCRKPQTQLVRSYLTMPELDRLHSYVIGDRDTDLLLAKNMDLQGWKLGPQEGWGSITQKVLGQSRTASVTRKTRETSIQVQVDLDGNRSVQISTGLGFFDHMLEQLAHHGSLGATIRAEGDLHIDDHHTVEDVGIALGTALRKALGDKTGIERFGFYLPMDDASTRVAMDLSGRSYFKFEGKFSRDSVGGLSTEMIPHFFKSFSESLGANLHIQMKGENTHHQVESIFKAVGRSLRVAILKPQANSPFGCAIPSTKGVL